VAEATDHPVPLRTIAREWGRIGVIGFGGPPAHLTLLRRLCVDQRGWMDEHDFEDAVATANLLPGPASTQVALYCAWRLRRLAGLLVGGAGFILPGLTAILALAALFLAGTPPRAVLGAAAGAGAAVPAVALAAALALIPASWHRAGTGGGRARWIVYAALGGATAALSGRLLVFVILGAGLVETLVRARPGRPGFFPLLAAAAPATGGTLALIWVALKVGALSFGGGFVIIPLMQADAVSHYHWMTNSQFLTAVALGQVTPGPVVQTVAVVGYAEGGLPAGLLAALVAFTPSFLFVGLGAPHFERLRSAPRLRAFLAGAGPAACGAIAGSAIPLARALSHLWQLPVLALALLVVLGLRRSSLVALLGAGALGVVAALAGAPLR
jgi:chromate transporter